MGAPSFEGIITCELGIADVIHGEQHKDDTNGNR